VQEHYIARVIEDLVRAAEFAASRRLHLPRTAGSIYLGGGTPSLLQPKLIARLFRAIRAEFDLADGAEITAECAPGQLSGETLEAFSAAGVNRISFGVQSFVDAEAAQAGRLHTRAIFLSDLRRVRAAGISNINIDLIAGLAGQTIASWRESLAALVEAAAPHASIYMHEVDQDSRLGRELIAGGSRYRAAQVPDEAAIIAMYEAGIEVLNTAGVRQYEISNFARPGFESRHNLRYWRREPYLGFGLDASSFLYAVEEREDFTALRWSETDALSAFLNRAEAPEENVIGRRAALEESLFLGLRMNRGLRLSALQEEYGGDAAQAVIAAAQPMIGQGLLTLDEDSLRLTARGRLLSNEVFAAFLADSTGSALK
jgi:oxygen-independent coproporphyrinogen-3 oxidase